MPADQISFDISKLVCWFHSWGHMGVKLTEMRRPYVKSEHTKADQLCSISVSAGGWRNMFCPKGGQVAGSHSDPFLSPDALHVEHVSIQS